MVLDWIAVKLDPLGDVEADGAESRNPLSLHPVR